VARGTIRNTRSRELQGRRAGFVSRVVAGAVDGAVIFGMYVGLLAAVGIVRFLLTDEKLHIPRPDPLVTFLVIGILAVIVLSTAWSGSGRTIGDDVVGLRVVTATGGDVTSGRAFVRALVVVGTLGLCLLTALVSRRNNGFHDWLCRTAVVYEWRPRLVSESRPSE
jgi:uncharacterized RDD family membrane protein YckC